MYTLDITDAAEQDLDRITDYLGVTLANPQAALTLLDEVEKINAELVSNPSIYPLCAAANLADLGYHKVEPTPCWIRPYAILEETLRHTLTTHCSSSKRSRARPQKGLKRDPKEPVEEP